MSAPVSAAPPVQPAPTVGVSGILSAVTLSPVFWVWLSLILIPMLLFSYGAAKVNWSVNQSYGWAFLSFIFSSLYYPYYAFFQLPTMGTVSSTLQAIGARRRR